MFNIRRSVFETNSSSTHSVAICTDEEDISWSREECLNQLKDLGATITGPKSWSKTLNLATIESKFWEFGRSYEAYNDFAIKLIYALISFQNDTILTTGLCTFVKRFLDADRIILPFEYSSYSTISNFELIGDIDHDSTQTLAETLQHITLEKYLLNKNVYLVIDNEG